MKFLMTVKIIFNSLKNGLAMLRTVQPYFKIMRIFLYIDLDSLSVYLFPINEKTAE